MDGKGRKVMLGIHLTKNKTEKYVITGDDGIIKAAGDDLSSVDGSNLSATYEDVAKAYRIASDSFIDDIENKVQKCKEYVVIRDKFLVEQNSKVGRK
jgi:hypothetical protein